MDVFEDRGRSVAILNRDRLLVLMRGERGFTC
jgi:hypothetical protein